MKTRVLPVEEWHRLGPCGLQVAPYVDNENAEVHVIEDGGQIVGCLTVMRVPVLESFFILPEHRGNPGVVRALTGAAFRGARRWGHWAFSGAADSNVYEWLMRLGGRRIPAQFFAVPLEEESECRQQQ